MSPSSEEHIKVSDNEFDFGVEQVKPPINVSFIKDISGKDLKFHTKICFMLIYMDGNLETQRYRRNRHLISTLPLVKRSTRPTSEEVENVDA